MSIRLSSTLFAASISFKNSKSFYSDRSRSCRFSVRSCVSDSLNANKVSEGERERERIMETVWMFIEDVTLFCYAIGFLFVVLMLFCCVVWLYPKQEDILLLLVGTRSYPLFSCLCCWKLCLKKKKNKTFACFVWDLSPWVQNIQ